MRHALKIARIAGPLILAGVCLGSSIVAGCGRIGIDQREAPGDAAALDGPSAPDAPADTAPKVCPADTTELGAGSTTCIEVTERGLASWVDAAAACATVGRRLCTDAEWSLACTQASGLVDMFDDQTGEGSGSGSGGGSASNWEWTADMTAGEATKRGYLSCDDLATHGINDGAYDFRCCVPKS